MVYFEICNISAQINFVQFTLIYGPKNGRGKSDSSSRKKRPLLEGFGMERTNIPPSQEVETPARKSNIEPRRQPEFMPFPEPDDPNGTPRLF